MLAVCLLAASAAGVVSHGLHAHATRHAAKATATPAARVATVPAIVDPATPASTASVTSTPTPSGTPTPTPSDTPTPTGPAQARAALDAFDRAFYRVSGGKALFAQTTAGGTAQFWRQAEMLEMVEDAYAHSHRATYRRMIGELRAGIVARFGTDWLRNTYNDDIMWMVIAWLRAYQLTGDRSYRDQAKRAFDGVYARAHDRALGGGLWWTTSRHEKNACVNGPAAIAACLLARDLHAPSYLKKARALFAWLAATLYDPSDGAVYDKISRDGTVDHSTYTYNQGTFIGAADLLGGATGLAGYRHRADLTLRFTHDQLTVDGILVGEGSGDGGGFKGIFARWASRFVIHDRLTVYKTWLDDNADTAWARRDARGLIAGDWSLPTPSGTLHALDCSSAVALLQDRP